MNALEIDQSRLSSLKVELDENAIDFYPKIAFWKSHMILSNF